MLPLTGSLALAIGSIATVIVLIAPKYALALLALAVPYGDLVRIPVGGLDVTAAEVMLGLIVAAWLARSISGEGIVLRCPIVWVPLGAVLVVALLSAAGAPALSLALKEIVKWLEFGLAMTLAIQLVETDRDRRFVVAAVLLACASQAVYGLYQTAADAGPIGFLLGGSIRAFGTFDQPNPFAIYLATGLTLAIGLGMSIVRSGWRRLISPFGLLLLICAFVIAEAVLASSSRSAWLALVAAVGVMIALQGRRFALAGVGAVLLVLGFGIVGGFSVLPASITARLSILSENFSLFDARDALVTTQNFAVVHRMAIWQAAWDMFLDHPLLGVGPGNFDFHYLDYALPKWDEPPGHAHNYFLNLLAEQGVLGLGAYITMIGSLAMLLLRTLRSLPNSMGTDWWLSHGLVSGALGVLALLTVQHAFDNLYVHSIGIQIGLLVGLGLGTQQAAPKDTA